MIEKHIDQLQLRAERLCEEYYKKEEELLTTIPGISTKSTIQVIAESGSDMQAFDNSKKYTSWIGFCSRNDESAGKFKSRAITKGNKYIRRIIVQAAWGAIRTKNSHFDHKFRKLTTRKGPKKAIVAIGRKLTVIAWNISKNRQEFNADLLPIFEPQDIEKTIEYYKRVIAGLAELFESSKE